MKVKELIEKLQDCNPEAEVGYEHLFLDYVHQDTEDYVETGGLSRYRYSPWVDSNKYLPKDFGIEPGTHVLLYFKDFSGKYRYDVFKAEAVDTVRFKVYWTTFVNFEEKNKMVNVPRVW